MPRLFLIAALLTALLIAVFHEEPTAAACLDAGLSPAHCLSEYR